MRILITGAAGFLGSHLSKKMLSLNHDVVGLDDLSTGSERNLKLLEKHPNFHFVRHDVRESYFAEVDFILNLSLAHSNNTGPNTDVIKAITTIKLEMRLTIGNKQ